MSLKAPIEVRSVKIETIVGSAPTINDDDTADLRILNVKDGNTKHLVVKGKGVDLRELNLARQGRKPPAAEVTSEDSKKVATATR